jgi:DNA repair exonuclease SbcCD ATPase subunit
MRLLSARVRDYRLHRDLSISFDPKFTVIAGPNQSGKSTLAEALHRALFLPVKTGGELLKGMQSDPFMAEPEVELCFEAAGDRWELRKRFAGTRGSASLRDSAGRSLQGEDAEERLAELVGTAAVARNRGAADQLKERWGHLWVWQGLASSNPFGLSTDGYDHDRLVEQLQAGAELGVQSPLDLAVIEDIQNRWSAIYTAGGDNRAPQVKKGSGLQLARAAVAAAQDDLGTIADQIAQQAEAEQAFQAAEAELELVRQTLPARKGERRDLETQLVRCKELENAIALAQPQLQAAEKQRDDLRHDHNQLQDLQLQRIALEAAKAPDLERLNSLQEQLPALELARGQALESLDQQEVTASEASKAATSFERQQKRLQQRMDQARLRSQLEVLNTNQARFTELQADLAQLPELTASNVDLLRQRETAVRDARVRAEALSAGIEVIRAGRTVRVDGLELAAGSRRLLSEPALLQVGDDVELRLIPGDGSSAAQADAVLQAATQAFAAELHRWNVSTVEEAATAERRRSDLLAEQQRLIEQRGGADPDELRRRLNGLSETLEEQPALDPEDASLNEEALGQRLRESEPQLIAARQLRDAAAALTRERRTDLEQCTTKLEMHRREIAAAEAALRERENQTITMLARIHALLERHSSSDALADALTQASQRFTELARELAKLQGELNGLGGESLKRQAAALDEQINSLERQEREASEKRIRAESRLHADGQVDLQSELEQKQAELESRLVELERLEKEAGMLTLLRRLLEEEQNAMATKYTTPLTERIGCYLAEVFPEAPKTNLSYDARKGFQQLEWRRGNEAVFGFDSLSTGAREQFAAALRVTIAEVLAEAYEGTLPVLFDDAFANSDPERQAGVYRMLQKASEQGLQVILLTCDPERSQAIKNARHMLLGDGGSI